MSTIEPYESYNGLSMSNARADRSFSPDLAATTASWLPRTVVYTLPAESESRVSFSTRLRATPSLVLCLAVLFFF